MVLAFFFPDWQYQNQKKLLKEMARKLEVVGVKYNKYQYYQDAFKFV